MQSKLLHSAAAVKQFKRRNVEVSQSLTVNGDAARLLCYAGISLNVIVLWIRIFVAMPLIARLLSWVFSPSSIPASSMLCISMRLVMALATTWESSMLLSVALLFLLFSQASTLCYYPNGDLNDDLACNPSAAVSACCQRNWTCLSNGVCGLTNSTGGTNYGRHSCTDKSWNSPACPQFCLSG